MDETIRPELHTGDVHDDDARIIDLNFLEVDTPPVPITEPIPVVSLSQPVPTTRLIGGNQLLDPSWDPILLLPSDSHRVGLIFRVFSPTAVATDYVMIVDDSGKVMYPASAPRIFHGQELRLDAHTGAIVVSAKGSSAPINISVWSVTK